MICSRAVPTLRRCTLCLQVPARPEQVVLLGKCAAALLLANAAYLSVDQFKQETSLNDVKYLFDRRTDTHVRGASACNAGQSPWAIADALCSVAGQIPCMQQ